jgi:hypothetical protein
VLDRGLGEPKCDGIAGTRVGVQEFQVLAPNVLEFPQRHGPYHLGNVPDKPLPYRPVAHGGQRITQGGPCPADNIQNGSLSSRVPLKYLRICR